MPIRLRSVQNPERSAWVILDFDFLPGANPADAGKSVDFPFLANRISLYLTCFGSSVPQKTTGTAIHYLDAKLVFRDAEGIDTFFVPISPNRNIGVPSGNTYAPVPSASGISSRRTITTYDSVGQAYSAAMPLSYGWTIRGTSHPNPFVNTQTTESNDGGFDMLFVGAFNDANNQSFYSAVAPLVFHAYAKSAHIFIMPWTAANPNFSSSKFFFGAALMHVEYV